MIYDDVLLCAALSVCCFFCCFCSRKMLPSTALNAFVAIRAGALCASVWSTIVAIGSFLSSSFLIIGYAIQSSPLSQLVHYIRLNSDGGLSMCVCAWLRHQRSFDVLCSKNSTRKIQMYDIHFSNTGGCTMIENYYFVLSRFMSLCLLAFSPGIVDGFGDEKWKKEKHFQTPPFLCELRMFSTRVDSKLIP